MANLLSIKRRISTAQNVSKTTRAMQMISASKLKKAQENALSSRPYVEKLSMISSNLAQKVDSDQKNEYLKSKTTGKTLFVLISPDKGLCGGLVTNLARFINELTKESKDYSFLTVGKKAEIIAQRYGKEILASFEFGNTLPNFENVFPILKIAEENFLSTKISNVNLVFTNFKSLFVQYPIVNNLLPIEFSDESDNKTTGVNLFEPNLESLLPYLIKHYLEMSIHQALLENYLSEQAARMFAMQNATDNANDVISELKLEYNKLRQEKITNEILDITGGVFA